MPKINIDLDDDASEDDELHASINSFYDDPMDMTVNAIVQDDIESMAARFAELYRLKVAYELRDFLEYPDVDDYLLSLKDQIKEDMGMQAGSNDFIAFNEYLDFLPKLSNSNAKNIMQNT